MIFYIIYIYLYFYQIYEDKKLHIFLRFYNFFLYNQAKPPI